MGNMMMMMMHGACGRHQAAELSVEWFSAGTSIHAESPTWWRIKCVYKDCNSGQALTHDHQHSTISF
jgi:hypothetical protein